MGWKRPVKSGLGLTIENEPHRQRIMKERGLRNVDKTEVEESIHAGYAEKMEHEKNVTNFLENSKTMNTGDAIDKTFGIDPNNP